MNLNRSHKKIEIFLCLVICLAILILVSSIKGYKGLLIDEMSENALPVLVPSNSIDLPNSKYNNHGFTCTGMTYDEADECFWVCNYGLESVAEDIKKPSLIKLSRNFEIIQEIDFSSINHNINDINMQGVAYDSSSDSLWVSVGQSLVNITKQGKLINRIFVDLDCAMNGVCYEEKTDTIWILCYKDYLLNITKEGKILKIISCNIKDQDQLAYSEQGELYFTAGADYRGEKNFLYKVDKDNEQICAYCVLKNSYALEGICFLDGKLFVMNDGFYHDAYIKKNYVNIYTFVGR